jgi:hypothetical protein
MRSFVVSLGGKNLSRENPYARLGVSGVVSASLVKKRDPIIGGCRKKEGYMDFLEDLFDFGGRRGRGRHGQGRSHDHHHEDDDAHHGSAHHDDDDQVHPNTDNQPLICAKCLKRAPASSKFCPECGNPFKPNFKCESCDGRLQPESKFCPACGMKTAA